MDRGAIIAVLSMLFYFTSLLGAPGPGAVQPLAAPAEQRTYEVVGQTAQVTADAVTVRSAPAADAQALGVLKGDARQVIILDKDESWYKIRPSSGPIGWVPAYALRVTPVTPKQLDRIILGYYDPGGPAYETLLEHSAKLTAAAPLGWNLDSDGKLRASFDPQEMGRSLYFAGNQELFTFAHVRIPAPPTALLANAALQEASLDTLVATVQEWGLRGILIHVDYVPTWEQEELFAFVAALKSKMTAQGRYTLISLPWAEGLDYAAAGQGADYLVLQTSAVPAEPGPAAALPAVEEMITTVSQVVPGERIILGLSVSGLHWPRGGMLQALSHGEAMGLAAREGAKIRWDTASQTPYFQYGNGQEVWFENRYSLKHKLELVAKFNLAGVALANLGQEDPALWETALQLLIG
ncbi:MAG: SH3 domain-containing protein [Firmicutes bacterium]|nr:SH3 domain-containing protein [Bacillota bacterium]